MKRAQSVKKPRNELGLPDSDQSSVISDTESEKKRLNNAIRKADQTFDMLDACTQRYRVKNRMDDKTFKLMERMDLDRPILQKEKYDLIFLEKAPDEMPNEADYRGGLTKRTLNDLESAANSPKQGSFEQMYKKNKPGEKFIDKMNKFTKTIDNMSSYAKTNKGGEQQFI